MYVILHAMNRFYHVTFGLMIIGLAILCFYAPWTQPEVGSVNVHQTIGYAPVWSDTFAQNSCGARGLERGFCSVCRRDCVFLLCLER